MHSTCKPSPAFVRIFTDFASAQPIWAAPQPRNVVDSELVAAPWQHIDLCSLSYRHPAHPGRRAQDEAHSESRGLERVSLRLQARERIALVGSSGSGKSTLLRLLAGLNTPRQMATSSLTAWKRGGPRRCKARQR